VGHLRKTEVRRIAREAGLTNHASATPRASASSASAVPRVPLALPAARAGPDVSADGDPRRAPGAHVLHDRPAQGLGIGGRRDGGVSPGTSQARTWGNNTLCRGPGPRSRAPAASAASRPPTRAGWPARRPATARTARRPATGRRMRPAN
jgi:hypothetical protein